jgi:AcrR family transcriptional regulator
MGNVEKDAMTSLGRKPKVSREAIILVAWNLFEQKGYHATSMTDIAEQAGISRRTLFNYFAHKEALLDPGRVEYMEQFTQLLSERPHDEPLFESMQKVVAMLPALGDEIASLSSPGPEILRARLTDEAVAYARDFCAHEIQKAVLARLAADPMAKVKAGLVAALSSQVLTELVHLVRDQQMTPEAALLAVLESLNEVFSLTR